MARVGGSVLDQIGPVRDGERVETGSAWRGAPPRGAWLSAGDGKPRHPLPAAAPRPAGSGR